MPANCPVTRAAFERINRNMKRAQIKTILDGPPEDYRTGPVELDDEDLVFAYSGSRILETTLETWEGDEGTVWGYFYSNATMRIQRFTVGRVELRDRPLHVSASLAK
jgi:hypothetical protein